MSPTASAASRASPWLRRTLRWGLLALAALLAAQYLAGFLFLWSVRADARTASPLTIARYAHYYGDRSAIASRLKVCSAVGAALVGVSALAGIVPRRRSLHGDARFARGAEIADAGLLSGGGVILGRLGARYLMLPGQQGVALAAPPRAGKGAGVVVPNLLTWPDSLICIDIKRENWGLTAGFRQKAGQKCFLFDPFAEDGCTARWNPLFYVATEPSRRLNDLQRIADMLYPEPPAGDPFWPASARSLFLAVALYLFETPSLPKTIGEVLRQGMASSEEGFGHHWKRVIEGRKVGPHPLSPQCVRSLYDLIDLSPVTASSIRKSFTSRLDLWLNPILDQATSGNDFDLRELRREGLSIYVAVNPDDLHRLRPVLALFFQQAIGLQTRVLPEHDPTLTRQVLMVLDEFPALGRIPIIAESISYLPGYNVRVLMVMQTPAQLREIYGPQLTETMLKRLAARIVYAPKDAADAREISEELGFMTVKVKSTSRPLWGFSGARGRQGPSVNVSEQRRALLLPQEVKALGRRRSIVFYEGMPPIRCKKIRYFRDRRLKARILRAPLVPRFEMPEAMPIQEVEPVAPDHGIAEGGPAVEAGSAAKATTRLATAADIEQIESVQLEDLDVDVSQLNFPDKDKLSLEEISGLADALVESFRAGSAERG